MSLLSDLISLISPQVVSPISDKQNIQLHQNDSNANFDLYMKSKGFRQTGDNSYTAGPPTPTPLPQNLATIPNDPGAPYNNTIVSSAKQFNVPAPLLKGVLAHESMQFNPKYVGGYHTDGTGRGIGGIDKNAHPEVSDEDAFNPGKAIPWVAKTLSGLYSQEGSWQNALRRYNGGGNYASNQPGFEGVPVAQRTMNYATNVYKQMQSFASGSDNSGYSH